MKLLYACSVLFLFYFTASAQVSFDQLPHDLQLYPRDTASQAQVPVSGTITAAGYTKIGMQVLREGKLARVVSQTLSPAATNTPFRLTAPIKAERAEYQFRVFLYRGADSMLVADRKRVVCGDVYILHGQSNASALAGLDTYYSFDFDDKYLRNCTYPYGSSNIPGEMKWYAAKEPYGNVGGFGLTLQRLIMEQYGIPTAVLNGAFGGTGIAALSARDPVNHANLSTFYGRLLFRAQWAGVAKQVKGIIWKQGEDEAGNGADGYDEKFKTLYNQLREDYGNARIYVGQINILADRVEGAAALRDFQRRTKYLFKNVETIATIGARGYDGIHYDPLGHQQLAYEQFRQIARDFYGSKDTVQINSPDIKKVFYNTRKDSITLVFDEGMQMVWKDTAYYNFATGAKLGSRDLKDYFYLDGEAGWVTAGSASGNRVTLRLKQPASAKQIRYLPAYFSDALSPFYNGPTLRNTRGMRAFSFDGVAISDQITTVTTLAAKPLSEKQIQLSWTAPPTAQRQVLERADGTPATFKTLATLEAGKATYTDENLPDPFGTYFYRLRAFSDVSESAYSNVVTARPLVLGTIAEAGPAIRLYPNPLAADRTLRVDAGQRTIIALTVRDLMGRTVKNWQGKAPRELAITLDEVTAGLYVAELQTADGQVQQQKIIVR
ncbi:T9SS type A sorting domain-containing protein [Spirosoma taeanense]|uniref:T9SS type A sorting domain-containing protein n=1 Tax=Spirosoma taeanense TaxID=2735870 RepID=A0A6M5YCR5_9BACT|nr:sialate O-acetylesterase [Spirosoma taeanense]QJW90742.1 T9SS type A sorting domain-containing protein [Spirosoma taeanense]